MRCLRVDSHLAGWLIFKLHEHDDDDDGWLPTDYCTLWYRERERPRRRRQREKTIKWDLEQKYNSEQETLAFDTLSKLKIFQR